MKIVKVNAAPLTNFEVLDFLRSRGAAKDPSRVIVDIASSEFKVFDYLEQSAACSQTRESVKEFAEKCKKFKLPNSVIVNLINIRPSAVVDIDPILGQECVRLLGESSIEELVELVAEVFPAPTRIESNEADDGQQMETS